MKLPITALVTTRNEEANLERTLAAGHRTKDIHTPGTTLVGTTAMADRVVRELEALYR